MLYDQLKMWQPKIFQSVDFPPNLRSIIENLGEKNQGTTCMWLLSLRIDGGRE